MTWSIKQNDREPAFTARLLEDGSPMDLAGASVRFIMKHVDAAEDEDPKVDAEASVVDEDLAMVTYDWASGDTDTPGLYKAEFELTLSNGRTRTVPTKDYLHIRVIADLG